MRAMLRRHCGSRARGSGVAASSVLTDRFARPLPGVALTQSSIVGRTQRATSVVASAAADKAACASRRVAAFG